MNYEKMIIAQELEAYYKANSTYLQTPLKTKGVYITLTVITALRHMMLRGYYKNNLPAQWASTFDLSWSVIACNAFRRCRCIGRRPAVGRLPSQRRRKTYGPRSVGD